MANNNKSPKNIAKWVFSVFMFSACLACGFSFASVIFVLLGVYFLPIASIQNFIDKFIPKKKALRGIIALVLFIIGCCFAPQGETSIPGTTNPTEDVILSTEATNSIADVTTEATQETQYNTEQAPPTVTDAPATTDTPVDTDVDTDMATPPTSAPATPSATTPGNSTFEIYFIDVGQADAALVLCDGKTMLIDGGNAEDSNLLYSFLKRNQTNHLDYVIGTHAHEDHIGGLAGALNYASVGTAYCPVKSYDTKAFTNFVSALGKHGVSITVPSKGDTFQLGSATCTILAVNTDLSDPNNTSIVLRIVYGDTSFLFTGDAEDVVEQAILNSGTNIKSTVLKVGHHGSNSSTGYVWLREIMPQHAVISVGKGNSYGHPTEEVLSRLRDAEVKTYRTDLQGDIVCVSDGKNVTFTVDKNANADVFDNLGSNSTQQTTPPETQPPETEAPATEPPETEAPATEPPETQPPETQPPETQPPETQPPETEPPETQPPETQPPETQPPETQPPETQPPETQPPETQPPETEPPVNNGQDYVANTNTKKFHYPSCSSADDISESNRWNYSGTRDDLINMGYVPCKRCHP